MFRKAPLLVAALSALTFARPACADDLPTPLTREAVLSWVVREHPRVASVRVRAEAIDKEADGAGKLPSPELSVDIWSVPFSKPYALSQASMISVGLRQRFPSLGSLGARADAGHAEARAERLEADDQERDVRRVAAHAYVDYEEAAARARTHLDHLSVARRIVEVSRAWYVSAGSSIEAAQAEVELAQMQADRATDLTLKDRTRSRLNALLQRPIDAPLGDPATIDATVPAWSLTELVQQAQERRPDVKAVRAGHDAAEALRVAARREWLIPSFSVGVLYFPPTSAAPEHGFGVSLGVELPWLWGAGKNRTDAATLASEAAALAIRARNIDVNAEVAEADANVRTQALRLRILQEMVLPATRRTLDAALASYVVSRADFALLLATRRSLIDTDLQIIAARAALDHALVELEAAVGGPVPRAPLASVGLP